MDTNSNGLASTQQVISLSLDEFCRRKQMGDQFTLLNCRRREMKEEIDEEALNEDLESYAKRAALLRKMNMMKSAGVAEPSVLASRSNMMQSTESPEPSAIAGSSKFDRFRDAKNSDDEEDDFESRRQAYEDVDMNEYCKQALGNIKEEAESDEGEDISDVCNFQTAESLQGIRVRSQQFRLLPENLVDRLPGMPGLEVVPLDEPERYKKKRIRQGRVNKNNLSRCSSMNSLGSINSFRNMSRSDVLAGTFIEKGKFTYKFSDPNGNGNQERVIGIERAKKFDQAPVNPVQLQTGGVNVNMEVLFEGIAKTVEKVMDAREKSSEKVAAVNLFKMLQNKREKNKTQKYDMGIQKQIAQIQNSSLIYKDNGNHQIIIPNDAGGIEDLQPKPHSSNMAMNMRFA